MANELAMTCMSSVTPRMDVDMIELRRSERIAKIQQDKQNANEPVKQNEVKKPKKTNKKEIKPKQAIKKKPATQKTRKALKTAIDILLTANDMSQIKINHLFTLIKKYCPVEERSFKYSILQTILKNYKQIGIQNTLQDLSTHMPKVVQYLSAQYNVIAVQDALNSMFAFPELMQSHPTLKQSQEAQCVDDLVAMMATTRISVSTHKYSNYDDLSALFAKCSLL